ncbi:MAG: hypothetical protein V3V01_03035 [Acidimicrobiales bacterium]
MSDTTQRTGSGRLIRDVSDTIAVGVAEAAAAHRLGFGHHVLSWLLTSPWRRLASLRVSERWRAREGAVCGVVRGRAGNGLGRTRSVGGA